MKKIILIIVICIGVIFYIKKDIGNISHTVFIKQDNELEEEIETLKKQLDLNKVLTEYKIENATVLSRNKSYWLSTLIIDKGKNNGIDKDMLVVGDRGLIGKIDKVYKYTSVVKLITSNDKDFKISVVINVGENDYYGILSGYENNYLIINDLDKNSNIEEGNIVTTSGIGVFFPKGIYIGKVSKVLYDKYSLSKSVYVELKQDFNSVHYVGVLK